MDLRPDEDGRRPSGGILSAKSAYGNVADCIDYVSQLADADWLAAEVILSEKEVRDLIPRLKRAGATGLVEYPLNKVIY
jgi:ATP phosphoribosyltransferase